MEVEEREKATDKILRDARKAARTKLSLRPHLPFLAPDCVEKVGSSERRETLFQTILSERNDDSNRMPFRFYPVRIA